MQYFVKARQTNTHLQARGKPLLQLCCKAMRKEIKAAPELKIQLF